MSDNFPMFRLATLLARQMSSPIASRIKEFAKTHPRFGRAVCMRLGQAHSTVDTRFKLWMLRLRQPKAISALSDTVALNAGADILGEIILFTLGSSIIIFEVNRQASNLQVKKLAERSRRAAVRLQLEELRCELELQESELGRVRGLAAGRERPRR